MCKKEIVIKLDTNELKESLSEIIVYISELNDRIDLLENELNRIKD